MFRTTSKITEQTIGAFRLPPELIQNFYVEDKDIFIFSDRFKQFDTTNQLKTLSTLFSIFKQSEPNLSKENIKLDIETLMHLIEFLQELTIQQMDIQSVPELTTEENVEIDLETLDDLLNNDDLKFLYQAIMKSSNSFIDSENYEGSEDLEILNRMYPSNKKKELKKFFSLLSKIL